MASGTRWPSAVDYQTALQIPQLCFIDPALQQGEVVTDGFGLPLAASGNVVVVFRMKLDGGDVALRCFTRQGALAALQRRYEALHAHLERYHFPALVESRYLPEALLVGGQPYPVVVMQWVRGRHLHRFVARHLKDADVLHALADRWRILMAQLRAAHIAHGDLSDGNVLVDRQGQLRLIDYDAAYVPALRDEPPGELGKPHYQHPERLRADGPAYGYYAENVDAFSALVVYLSLRALADDPARWRRYHAGENLIFVQADYEHPGYSPIWQDLRGSRDDEVRALAGVLEGFCRAPLDALPDLEEALRETAPRPLTNRLPALEQAPEAPPVQEPPAPPRPMAPKRPASPPRRRRRLAAALSLAAALVALVAFVLLPGGAAPAGREAPAPAPVVAPAPEELAGFYTGYATLLDGSREALVLTIAPPDSGSAGPEVRLPYAINWTSHQSGGIGRYNVETGHLDLENHYELYVAFAGEDKVVLASPEQRQQRPLVQVNKRKTL